MSAQQFSLGLDLGTSNCSMALAPADEGVIELMKVTQVLGPNSIGEQSLFPSALYFTRKDEFERGAVAFRPRGGGRAKAQSEADGSHIIGAFAREHGEQSPARLITSAKSWLCNQHVDPRERVLPWHSEEVPRASKLSAFDATRCYLDHLKESYLLQGRDKHATLKSTLLVLTVPASFDELARTLTIEAAHKAGFAEVTLLEEPQAAFYAWIESKGDRWREHVRAGDLLLVCDVGGGTCDFSLIVVNDKRGNLDLERVSVGRHILLGGDNVDLALAYSLRRQMRKERKQIDDWQFRALVGACRKAKEKLATDSRRKDVPVAVPARGSNVMASTVTTRLRRGTLNRVLYEGFLPLRPISELPEPQQGAGLRELGLGYEHDPILSRHLARFLTGSYESVSSNSALAARMPPGALAGGGFLRPTAVLFNGGFFKARKCRERVLALLHSWAPDAKIRELKGCDYELAVAKGACYYGLNKLTDRGIRIRAGAARSYYLGLEPNVPPAPGFKPELEAICVVPQGMEEGSEAVLKSEEFGLTLGEEVVFRFFSSNRRAGDPMGLVVEHAEDELEETASLRTSLAPVEGLKAGRTVPVRLHSRVTEMGTLELWMQHVRTKHQWKLEFSVRTR